MTDITKNVVETAQQYQQRLNTTPSSDGLSTHSNLPSPPSSGKNRPLVDPYKLGSVVRHNFGSIENESLPHITHLTSSHIYSVVVVNPHVESSRPSRVRPLLLGDDDDQSQGIPMREQELSPKTNSEPNTPSYILNEEPLRSSFEFKDSNQLLLDDDLHPEGDFIDTSLRPTLISYDRIPSFEHSRLETANSQNAPSLDETDHLIAPSSALPPSPPSQEIPMSTFSTPSSSSTIPSACPPPEPPQSNVLTHALQSGMDLCRWQ